MWGNRRGGGKKILTGDDVSLICEIDENGNIIPETCEPLVEEERVVTKTLMYPKVNGRR